MFRLFTLRLNRWWRAFLFALAAYALVGGVMLLLVPDLAGVFLLGAYCIPSNSILPIPHEPGVLYFAKFYDPLWIATAATVGSLIASFADYAVVGSAIQHPIFQSTRDSRLYQWTIRWMKRWPFAIIVLFSFTPLPISVIRILAPASGYPISRYLLAQIVGRFPRFYLLALLGRVLMIPTWGVLTMMALLMLTIYLSGRKKPAQPDEPTEASTRPA